MVDICTGRPGLRPFRVEPGPKHYLHDGFKPYPGKNKIFWDGLSCAIPKQNIFGRLETKYFWPAQHIFFFFILSSGAGLDMMSRPLAITFFVFALSGLTYAFHWTGSVLGLKISTLKVSNGGNSYFGMTRSSLIIIEFFSQIFP